MASEVFASAVTEVGARIRQAMPTHIGAPVDKPEHISARQRMRARVGVTWVAAWGMAKTVSGPVCDVHQVVIYLAM
jgi:hypothetical protein